MEQFQKAASEILEQRDIKAFAGEIEREQKEIVIWGAGNCGHHVYDILSEQDIKISFFADNYRMGEKDYKTGIEIIGIDIVSATKKDLYVLISVVDENAYHTIYEELKGAGLKEEQLFDMRRFMERLPVSYFVQNCDSYKQVYSMLSDDFSKKVYLERIKRVYLLNDISAVVSPVDEEYFDEVNALTDEEVFVDCGGYDGDTSLHFVDRCDGKYKKIIVFEPEACKKEVIEKNLKGLKYIVYPYGVWNENKTVSFEARGDAASHVMDKESDNKIQVVMLDDYIYDEKPTFIKMDIEGSEMEALMGAKKVIRAYKPKLAVCLYHKPQDLFQIPIYIKSLNEGYRFYIRQYANSRYETVCYAL